MKLKVIASPNPFVSELFVFIHGSFALNIVVRLINNSGTVIRITSAELKKGENKLKINNLQRYAAGSYHLEIKLLSGELLETHQLVKA
ncbi:MAG: T9SS type A sorting domain-containing protein [Bacteroidota bacterium]